MGRKESNQTKNQTVYFAEACENALFAFWQTPYYRLRAKKRSCSPPLGNFADISYLEENFKPHLLRDVCTLCSGALVSDSLLHMLL